MRLNKLEKLYLSMRDRKPATTIPDDIPAPALGPPLRILGRPRHRLGDVLLEPEERIEAVPHHAPAIEPEGHPPGHQAEQAALHPEGLARRAAGVAEQQERQAVVTGEAAVRFHRVAADAVLGR